MFGGSVPFDVAHAVGNATFCLVFGPALVRALARFRTRMEVDWRPFERTVRMRALRGTVDGSLDTSFSGDGKQITHFGAGIVSTAAAVAIQPDGKILLAGSARVSAVERRYALARYRADGSLDSSFAGDGTVTTGREVLPV